MSKSFKIFIAAAERLTEKEREFLRTEILNKGHIPVQMAGFTGGGSEYSIEIDMNEINSCDGVIFVLSYLAGERIKEKINKTNCPLKGFRLADDREAGHNNEKGFSKFCKDCYGNECHLFFTQYEYYYTHFKNKPFVVMLNDNFNKDESFMKINALRMKEGKADLTGSYFRDSDDHAEFHRCVAKKQAIKYTEETVKQQCMRAVDHIVALITGTESEQKPKPVNVRTGKKPRLCLIYTGGTISMVDDEEDGLKPPTNPTRESFTSVAPEISDIADFEFELLMNKDSSNMNPNDWKAMAQKIYDLRNEGFDGFVVAHGTDTMHFSASAVALAIGSNLNFPVVFTGAQTIPEVKYGDARVNLVRGFKVATTDIAEVMVSFGEYVFRGCRAQKKDERHFDAFESPAMQPLARITHDIIPSSAARLRKENQDDINLINEFSPNILKVSLIPGLEPGLFEYLLSRNSQCKGIVLQSFGAGNVPNEDDYSWISFIEKSTREFGIPVLITSQFPANATTDTDYEPGRMAEEAGAIQTGNMTSACATAKFRWVIAQIEKRGLHRAARINGIRNMMNTPYVGEFDMKGL